VLLCFARASSLSLPPSLPPSLPTVSSSLRVAALCMCVSGLNPGITAAAMAASNVNGTGVSPPLQTLVSGRESLLIVTLPSVVVNGIIMRGTVSGPSVLSEICNALVVPPSVCDCEDVDPQVSRWTLLFPV
jgi:hypothetical protein